MKKALISILCVFLVLGIVGTGTVNFQYGYNTFVDTTDRLNAVVAPVIQLLMPPHSTTGQTYTISYHDNNDQWYSIKVQPITPAIYAKVFTIPFTFDADTTTFARGYLVTENTSDNDDFPVGSYVFYANPPTDQSYGTYLAPFVRILGLNYTKIPVRYKYVTLHNPNNPPPITGV